MYNEEIKKTYLNEIVQRNEHFKIYGVRAFNQIGNYEEELEKDCCNFTVNEIIIYYQRKCSTSLESLMWLNSLLKKYTNWCLQRNMITDNQNHYDEINADIIKNCLNYGMVNDKIISRKDLLHIIEDFKNVSEQTLPLALFEGICGDNMCELVNLKCEDMKTKKGKHIVKLCSGRELEISEELYNYCQESQNCYTHYNANIHNEYTIPFRPEDRGVFKAIDSSVATGINRKTLYNKLAKIKKKVNLNYMTTYSLLESGRIEMIKKIMTEKKISLDEVLASRVTEERYGRITSLTIWKKKYASYIEA